MKKIKNILFDLDGTLTDPAEGITNSVAHSLRRMGIAVPERSRLYSFIGPPLTDSYIEMFGMSEKQAYEAVDIYREYFAVRGLFENVPYAGITEVLSQLCDSGKRLVMATSKPEIFAARIAERFGLSRYFDFIAGSLLDGKRVKKAEVIEYALEGCGITDRDECIMVGDRSHDVLGAAACKIPCVGVLYGYGTTEELKAAGAKYICEDVESLGKLLLSL